MLCSVVIVFVKSHFLNSVNNLSEHRARSTVGRGSQRRVRRCLQLRH